MNAAFNTNKNAFLASLNQLRSDFHAFTVAGIPKGTRTAKQQRKALVATVTDAIDHIETDDFGVRVVILKVVQ